MSKKALAKLTSLKALLSQYEFDRADARQIKRLLGDLSDEIKAGGVQAPKKRGGKRDKWDIQWVIAAEGIGTDYRPLWPVVDALKDELKETYNTRDVFADETMDEVYFGGFSIFLSIELVELTKAEATMLLKDVKKRLVSGLKQAGYSPFGDPLDIDDVQGYGGRRGKAIEIQTF